MGKKAGLVKFFAPQGEELSVLQIQVKETKICVITFQPGFAVL